MEQIRRQEISDDLDSDRPRPDLKRPIKIGIERPSSACYLMRLGGRDATQIKTISDEMNGVLV